MRKFVMLTEVVVTSLEPRRINILAEECLVDVRFVESHSEDTGWHYEYEINGEVGKVEKLLLRIKDIDRKRG